MIAVAAADVADTDGTEPWTWVNASKPWNAYQSGMLWKLT